MRFRTKQDWHKRVSRVLSQMVLALDEPVTFRELADYAAASPYHFHRKFRELTGETVGDCIRRLRLERAAVLLRETDQRITDIALDSGYQTTESFSKGFKKAFDLTPSYLRTLPFWNGQLYSQAGIHYGAEPESLWFSIQTGGVKMETKIVNFEERRVIGVEHMGNPWGLPESWEKFNKLAAKYGLKKQAKNYLSLFPVPGEDGRQFAGIEVTMDLALPEGLSELYVSGGLYAVTVHFGTSEEIGTVWDLWLKEWLPGSGWIEDKTRFNYEWYQNDGSSVPPELQLTFLCTPVKKES